MPHCLSQDAYTRCHESINVKAQEKFCNFRNASLKSTHGACRDVGVEPEEEGMINIAVSYDGAWQKRGYSSNNGLGCVIDILTGLPVD